VSFFCNWLGSVEKNESKILRVARSYPLLFILGRISASVKPFLKSIAEGWQNESAGILEIDKKLTPAKIYVPLAPTLYSPALDEFPPLSSLF
jgi:hypothetical protein